VLLGAVGAAAATVPATSDALGTTAGAGDDWDLSQRSRMNVARKNDRAGMPAQTADSQP
jgi:hypothetical protein